jgi:spermidine synthase
MTSFEELDFQKTPLGDLILRRRTSPSAPSEPVYEVKLDDEMLMSSLVNAGEKALARLALEQRGEVPSSVLVGGLGLGYTAAAALEFPQVGRVVVVEFLDQVISWHRNRLVPAARILLDDPRCTLVRGDFFEHVAPGGQGESFDAILLDIDHSPESWLHERHAGFYTTAGLRGMAEHLRPGGVFGMWMATEPPAAFLDCAADVMVSVRAHEVPYFNPHLGMTVSDWVVVGDRGRGRVE